MLMMVMLMHADAGADGDADDGADAGADDGDAC